MHQKRHVLSAKYGSNMTQIKKASHYRPDIPVKRDANVIKRKKRVNSFQNAPKAPCFKRQVWFKHDAMFIKIEKSD